MEQALQEADIALKSVEAEFGSDDPRLADCLEAYATLLKEKKTRLLDAANMEARARVIRDKSSIYKSNVRQANAGEGFIEVEPIEPRSSSTDTKECQFCGETIKLVAIKCKHCGSMLADQKTSSTYLPKVKNANAQKQKDAGIAIILGVFFGYSGLHSFYLERYRSGAYYLIVSFLGSLLISFGLNAAASNLHPATSLGIVILFFEGVVLVNDLCTIPSFVQQYNAGKK
ncbi:MAG: TM2 domain-containing protein [Cyanobacteria bacterium SZAS-4]|nr:TM2 domain-containing protein [Cyanobacteria bacterium SZAS-4]